MNLFQLPGPLNPNRCFFDRHPGFVKYHSPSRYENLVLPELRHINPILSSDKKLQCKKQVCFVVESTKHTCLFSRPGKPDTGG
jgi:hypothetical protein